MKIPNSIKEALLLDRIDGDKKWHDSIQKKSMVLDKLSVCKLHPSHHEIPKEHQKALLRIIFYVKKEYLRRKSRRAAGECKIDSAI